MAENSTFKYIAIKNWRKYQSSKNGNKSPWVKDYTDKDFHPEYSKLSMSQRYMLDACCRLRGRHGENLANDPQWICRATAVTPRERHNATTAIQQLVNSGFLVLTNQQHHSLDIDIEVDIEIDVEPDKVPENPLAEPSESQPALPVIIELQTPTAYVLERRRENELIDAAFEHYCIATEKNRLTYRLTPQRRKIGVARLKDCLKLTKGDYEKAAGLLRIAIDKLAESDWHMGRDPGTKGKKYCDWDKNLFKSYESMERWFNA